MDETQLEQQSLKLVPGNIIAQRYKIIQQIGSGGMGAVFKVEHTTLHKTMALKLMHAHRKNQNDVSRFQREAKAASGLNHPNLVAVHDFGSTESGDLFIAMDFIEGKSLSQEIDATTALAQDEAIDIFIQVCEGMAAAHSKGVLHRDLKPSNIAIERSGKNLKAKVLDFGIAKFSDSAETADKLTQTGEILGSPAYMSPEQCMGQELDSRSDIYSMGCVMFETLTGKAPFAGDSPVHTLYKHMNERAPLLRSANSEVKVSPELERVILQALEKEPQNRYQSMEDLAADLKLIKEGKNPVNEVARMRKGVKRAASLAKITCLIFIVISPILFWRQLYEMCIPKWQKDFEYAEQQAQIQNFDDALANYKAALNEATLAHASKLDLAHLYFKMGMAYYLNHQFDSSIDAFTKSLSLGSSEPEAAERAFAHDFICGAYREKNDHKEAIKHGELALELKHKLYRDKKSGDQQLTANTLWKLTLSYRETGELEKSEQCAREWLQIELNLHPKKDHGYLAEANKELATTLLAEGKNEEALRYAEESSDISKRVFEPDNSRRLQIAKWLEGVYESVGKTKDKHN